ncbi:glycoside hydrolase family 89 protein [Talaromyces proteolyticus]|uniref:Glycoside hydrolase family 89 protein n=1 Tax=Talaromyces proteolyticus TaxID=1131652 RepID=A0AAD4Q0F3_9EURO|nr:glycoside hydrolase family 89 protein [Talaromyces proteolyticus]KAH8697216.1 glycoside hydrolase family 89 protein [Talaromyces proteolyticus]
MCVAATSSTQGLINLVQRRIPNHVNSFTFSLTDTNSTDKNGYIRQNDSYEVSSASNGTILIEGTSLSALATGLRRYLTEVAHVDIYWFVGSRLHTAPSHLPKLEMSLRGSSAVPWRYHFNTVTFSYTTAFWQWEDWELELDWAALHGVNLAIAWVGYEQSLRTAFKSIGMADDDILPFFSGPAFQAWNRFGNIQGSWGGSDLPLRWIEDQFSMQKKIVARMVELGITPALPAFPGFVPANITNAKPDVNVTRGSDWGGFPEQYSEVTFLDPLDPVFSELQKNIIQAQIEAFGNITNVYTLDQFNEITPASNDTGYLKKVSYSTWQGLKAANPAAIWLMQGWLFLQSTFWTNDRISAYLGGVENNNDMLILDLYSESVPLWQQTKSYYGKPWIWCQLHDFGGAMSLYGQIMNVTVNSTQALAQSDSLVGFGSTMEGQEGNEIMYDLMLDQAWSTEPLDAQSYFSNWTASRYSSGNAPVAPELFTAWDKLRLTAYNNTNSSTDCTPKAIYELRPSIEGLTDLAGHFPNPTTVNYDPSEMVDVWNLMIQAAKGNVSLWDHPAFQYDVVDVTRQVMANAFIDYYKDFVAAYKNGEDNLYSKRGEPLLQLLTDLDHVLSQNAAFDLSTWLSNAHRWSDNSSAAFYEYDALNQVTLWGPDGEISDYASKSWGGLVSSYYRERWSIFVQYVSETSYGSYNDTKIKSSIESFELKWQTKPFSPSPPSGEPTLERAIQRAQKNWPSVFNVKSGS